VGELLGFYHNRVICKVTLCFNPYPLFQCSRVIIVVVQVGAVKLYVAAVQALKKKETQNETQFTTKIGGKTSCLDPTYFIL